MTDTPVSAATGNNGLLKFLLDFGPLVIFFGASVLAKSDTDPLRGPIIATAVFMVAITVAAVVSKLKLGKISPMLKLTAALGLFFGALTLWFHDDRFIKIKPTVIYTFFSVILIGGWLRDRALLKYVIEQAYDGLTDEGWLKLSLNWGLFFAALAVANEIIWRNYSFETWAAIKAFGIPATTFVFALINIPMLTKHGLVLEEPAKD